MNRRTAALLRAQAAAAELAEAFAELAEAEGAEASSARAVRRPRERPDVPITDRDVALAKRALRRVGARE